MNEMTDGHFGAYELCDGSHCPRRRTCARWASRPDIDLMRCTPYLYFNTAVPYGGCRYWLPIPDEHYPSKNDGHAAR